MAKIIWQARVFAGGPLFAASTATQVTVIDKSNDTLASLWSDRDGTSVKANPFFITVAGKIEMYLDPGRYRVTAVNAGQTDTWEDVPIIDPDAGGGGGGGATNFTDLDDVPGSYSGQAGELVRVNSGETALEFAQFGPPLSVDSTSSSYTLSLAIWNQIKNITGSGTVNITIPLDSTLNLPVGFTHIVRPRDAFSGTCTWVKADVSMTLEPPAGGTLVLPAGATSAVAKIAANTWIVYGVTEAA